MAETPRRFETPQHWYDQTTRWVGLRPAPIRASIQPDEVRAGDAAEWVVTVTADGADLPQGSHLALEIPIYWYMELGRPYPVREELVPFGEGTSGMSAFVSARSSVEGLSFPLAISNTGRFYVVDVVIEGGDLPEGESIEIVIGEDTGSHVRAQHHAQRAILYLGVDLCDPKRSPGDGYYRQAPEHPTVNVTGAWAESIKLVAPAIVRQGEPFPVKVLPVDGYHENPATGYEGTVRLRGEGGAVAAGSARLRAPGDGRLQVVEELSFDGSVGAQDAEATLLEGDTAYVVACDAERGIAGRSNPVSAPLAEGLSIFFGDIHGQMDDSIGTGDYDEYYGWARDAELLDFAAPANHYGGRLDITDDVWRKCVDKTNEHNDAGRFVALQGYEWAARGGHKNVYWPTDDAQIYWGRLPEYDDPEKLWAALEGQEALTIPHHVKYIGNTDWEPRNDHFQRLVEICSAWGISESGGPRSVQVALARGHRLGFIGGTDTHLGQPGSGTHWGVEGRGLAAVYAPELTRRAVFDALYGRHCYATTGARIILSVTLNRHRMGEELAAEELDGPRELKITAIGTQEIVALEIVRNNEVVHRAEPGGQVAKVAWEDTANLGDVAFQPSYEGDVPFVYYYCRLLQADRHRAWSSPIWLNLG